MALAADRQANQPRRRTSTSVTVSPALGSLDLGLDLSGDHLGLAGDRDDDDDDNNNNSSNHNNYTYNYKGGDDDHPHRPYYHCHQPYCHHHHNNNNNNHNNNNQHHYNHDHHQHDDELDDFALKVSSFSTLLQQQLQQLRRLLVRLPALSTACLLASLLLFAFYVGLGQWKGSRVQVGDFLLTKTHGRPDAMPSLGILLHPQDHRSRSASVLTLHWTITAGFRAPDGVTKRVFLINGDFPGPTIEARSGDFLVVHVENALEAGDDDDDGLAIHWHGLHMAGHNDMDGAVGFTQCAIPPGRNFTYEFRIGLRQHGTFWYHAHSQAQRGDGLYGGMVVHRPGDEMASEAEKYGYQREVLLMVGDWFHRSTSEMSSFRNGGGAFDTEPVPDSLVVNGHGAFNCSKAAPARPIECSRIKVQSLPSIFGYDLALTRLRLVNTGSIAGLTVGISHAKVTPLQVDGGCEVLGSPSDSVGILYPGERVDMLVEWDVEVLSTGSELEIIMDPDNFQTPNPSLTPNQTFPIFPPFEAPSPQPIPPLTLPPPAMATAAPASQHFRLQSARAAPEEKREMEEATPVLPREADQIVLLYARTQKPTVQNRRAMGFINHTSWKPQSPPLISLARSDWDAHQLISDIVLPSVAGRDSSWWRNDGDGEDEEEYHDKNTMEAAPSAPWVDIIINNLDNATRPFHLHGHDFYVLATVAAPLSHMDDPNSISTSISASATISSYSPWDDDSSNGNDNDNDMAPRPPAPILDLDHPLRKDTVNVPRHGYAVIRFRAANAGLWMLHCHAWAARFDSGMAMGLRIWDGDEKAAAAAVVDGGAKGLCIL